MRVMTLKIPAPTASFRKQLSVPIGIVAAALAIGTTGYWLLWHNQGGTWLDALYMTVITIATIGFGEVKPLDSAGRIFTIAITILGTGSLVYVLGSLMEYVVQIQLNDLPAKRRKERLLKMLDKHTILVGFGRVGRKAAAELKAARQSFVVIDGTEAGVASAENEGYLCVWGDATEDEVLLQAGVDRASVIVVATGNDATNVYIVLSARSLNPDVFIVARAEEEQSIPKLLKAGANKAINPHAIGGHRLADMAMYRSETSTAGIGEARSLLETVELPAESPFAGMTLREAKFRETAAVSILLITRAAEVFPNPDPDMRLSAGDSLLIIGAADRREYFKRLAAGLIRL